MQKVKIVYAEGKDTQPKIIFGFIEGEDDYFYTVRADGSGTIFKLNKAWIVSIKYLGEGD